MTKTKPTLTILTNSFHGTSYKTRKTREELDAIAVRVQVGVATDAERAFARKVRGVLCVEDCRCARSVFGERD